MVPWEYGPLIFWLIFCVGFTSSSSQKSLMAPYFSAEASIISSSALAEEEIIDTCSLSGHILSVGTVVMFTFP